MLPPRRHAATTWCFAMNAGSISMPRPGPVGTVTTPASSLRSVEVAHVNGSSSLNSLNS
jgi:hypothetical protein